MFTEDDLGSEFIGLKLTKVVFSKSKNSCKFFFIYNPELCVLTEEKKNDLKQKFIEQIGQGVQIEFEFTKCIVNESIIGNYVYQTLINNFPAISKHLQTQDISVVCNGIDVSVQILLSPSIFDFANKSERIENILQKLNDNFVADFKVDLKEKAVDDVNNEATSDRMEFESSIKKVDINSFYEVSNIVDIVGKNDFQLAMDFTKINQPVNDVVICGTLKFVNKRFFNKTIIKDGNSVSIERCYFNFNISNGSNTMYCTIFPSDQHIAKIEEITVGTSIAMKGKMKLFQGKLSFTADTLCTCTYTQGQAKVEYKTVNDKYHIIFPQPYVELQQVDLFSNQENFESTRLLGEYIAFDLETTGKDYLQEQITEIGAVKIVDGKMTETFSTLVKPTKSIPQEVVDITGIDDDLVKDAPPIEHVLPDFFKFCHNATLVGYNIEFDYNFIQQAAKPMLYNFSHPQIDVYPLAKKSIKALTNYKLVTVAEHFNIDLKNAHRAVFDAVATAKVFMKLS